MRFTFVLLLAAMIPSGTLQPSLSGSWTLKAEAVVNARTANGGTWSRAALDGTLALEQQGDLVKGTWTATNGVPWAVTGRMQGEKFELSSAARETPVVLNGRKSTVAMRWTFRGVLKAGRLVGSCSFQRPDDETDLLRPFTAELAAAPGKVR